MGRGNVGQNLVVDAAPGRAHLLDGQAVVLGRPRDHGVRDEREARRLLGLALQVPRPDHALVREEQTASGRTASTRPVAG